MNYSVISLVFALSVCFVAELCCCGIRVREFVVVLLLHMCGSNCCYLFFYVDMICFVNLMHCHVVQCCRHELVTQHQKPTTLNVKLMCMSVTEHITYRIQCKAHATAQPCI